MTFWKNFKGMGFQKPDVNIVAITTLVTVTKTIFHANVFRNQNLPSPKQKLFASYDTPMSDKQIRDLLEEGKFFLACDAMKQGEDELAVEEFDKLNMADASYYQAQVTEFHRKIR